MSEVPMPPKEWLAELTAATDKAAAGYGWQAGYAAARTEAMAEAEQLRAKIAEYEHAITWDTTCLSCSTLLDSSIQETERAEQAEAAIERVRTLAKDAAAKAGYSNDFVDADAILAALNPAGGEGPNWAEHERQTRDHYADEIRRLSTAIERAREILPSFEGQVTALVDIHPALASTLSVTYRRFVFALNPAGGSEEKEDPKPCCDLHNPVVCESDEPGMDGPCCENCPSWPPAEGRAP